jgi:hypothetical protein
MGKVQIRRKKKPSEARKAHSETLRNGVNKENEDPAPVVKAQKAVHEPKNYKNAFTNSQRKFNHMSVKAIALKSQVSELQGQLKAKKKHRDIEVCRLENETRKAKDLAAQSEKRLVIAHAKLSRAKRVTSNLQQASRALGKRVHRAAGVLQCAIARTRAKPLTPKLTHQGMYTVHARQMARVIIATGAARDKVRSLMTKIAKIFGVKIHRDRSMSRRTASRCILEGGIAARMQNSHELSINEGARHTYCNFRD